MAKPTNATSASSEKHGSYPDRTAGGGKAVALNQATDRAVCTSDSIQRWISQNSRNDPWTPLNSRSGGSGSKETPSSTKKTVTNAQIDSNLERMLRSSGSPLIEVSDP